MDDILEVVVDELTDITWQYIFPTDQPTNTLSFVIGMKFDMIINIWSKLPGAYTDNRMLTDFLCLPVKTWHSPAVICLFNTHPTGSHAFLCRPPFHQVFRSHCKRREGLLAGPVCTPAAALWGVPSGTTAGSRSITITAQRRGLLSPRLGQVRHVRPPYC